MFPQSWRHRIVHNVLLRWIIKISLHCNWEAQENNTIIPPVPNFTVRQLTLILYTWGNATERSTAEASWAHHDRFIFHQGSKVLLFWWKMRPCEILFLLVHQRQFNDKLSLTILNFVFDLDNMLHACKYISNNCCSVQPCIVTPSWNNQQLCSLSMAVVVSWKRRIMKIQREKLKLEARTFGWIAEMGFGKIHHQ